MKEESCASGRIVNEPMQKTLVRYLRGEISRLEPSLRRQFELRFGVSFYCCGRKEVAERLGTAVREGRLKLASGTLNCLREDFGVTV